MRRPPLPRPRVARSPSNRIHTRSLTLLALLALGACRSNAEYSAQPASAAEPLAAPAQVPSERAPAELGAARSAEGGSAAPAANVSPSAAPSAPPSAGPGAKNAQPAPVAPPAARAAQAAPAEAARASEAERAPRLQAVSLLGRELWSPPVPEEARAVLEQRLAAAQADFARDPQSETAALWLGRRLSALNRFAEAVEAFDAGLAAHPDSYRLLRFRGHRLITLRQFARAEADLARAAELVEGRGLELEPNADPDAAKSYPISIQHQIYYHLALARYLQGHFAEALPAWERAYAWNGPDPDALCGSTHWRYMTLRRLGREQEAELLLEPIRAELAVREAGAYLRLCLMYKGLIAPEQLIASGEQDPVQLATLGYGLSNWQLYNGRREQAFAGFRRALELASWQAFGAIASEAELAREE